MHVLFLQKRAAQVLPTTMLATSREGEIRELEPTNRVVLKALDQDRLDQVVANSFLEEDKLRKDKLSKVELSQDSQGRVEPLEGC